MLMISGFIGLILRILIFLRNFLLNKNIIISIYHCSFDKDEETLQKLLSHLPITPSLSLMRSIFIQIHVLSFLCKIDKGTTLSANRNVSPVAFRIQKRKDQGCSF